MELSRKIHKVEIPLIPIPKERELDIVHYDTLAQAFFQGNIGPQDLFKLVTKVDGEWWETAMPFEPREIPVASFSYIRIGFS